MEQKSFFASSRLSLALTVFLLFGIALGIRAYDITDLPLDFHPSRQLFSAVKARGMYYETLPGAPEEQRKFAIQQWKTKVTIEPEIIERIAVFFYRLTGKEQLWIPRMVSALFWLVGGIFVFLLAYDMVSEDGAVLTLAFYLLTPYGIFASRSFQPDPLMVMLILVFWWLVYRWSTKPAWMWTVLAGLVGGLAIFVKFIAAFFVIGGALGALFGRYKMRELIRNPQVWALSVLGVIPGAAWIIYGKFFAGLFGGDLSGRFIPSLLVSPLFYLQWQVKAAAIASGIGIMLGLVGLFLVSWRARTFLLGLWGAYFVFGLYFNYHISTHDYYSLPLLPIVALSLAPLGSWFFARLRDTSYGIGWMRISLFIVLLYGVFSTVWNVRNVMKSVDYRSQEAYWLEIRDELGLQNSVIALTEDYGLRMVYWSWLKTALWPSSGDLYQADVRGNQRDIEKLFTETVASKALFLVTDLEDFAKQTDLQALLKDYSVIHGDGYLIYDLQHPLESQP